MNVAFILFVLLKVVVWNPFHLDVPGLSLLNIEYSSEEKPNSTCLLYEGIAENHVTKECEALSFGDTQLENWIIPKSSYNLENNTDFNVIQYSMLRSILIEDECGVNVHSIVIDNNPTLETMSIGSWTFTSIGTTFVVRNCTSLQTIQIGDNSLMYITSCTIESK